MLCRGMLRISTTPKFGIGLIKTLSTENVISSSAKSPDLEKLGRELRGRIRFSGPITVAEYMREVLTNPVHGFYHGLAGEVLGTQGHFITSPEISQMFGECLAVWFVNEWMKMGEPKDIHFVELGPGKGTLMSDLLRTFSKLKSPILEGLTVGLVEVSQGLKKVQKETLCESDSNKTKYGECSVNWYGSVDDIPDGFTIYLAHEFFDALPIHKFKNTAEGWRELLIDIDDDDDGSPKFRWVMSKNATPACVLINEFSDQVETEICPQAGIVLDKISQKIVNFGGLCLVADYDSDIHSGDTLRAFRKHQQVDPLELPGTADLTADVNFEYLKSKVHPNATFWGPSPQGQFLQSLGIGTRCKQLISTSKDDTEQRNVYEAYRTLTTPDAMGERFKFAAIFPTSMSFIHQKYPPVGFSQVDG